MSYKHFILVPFSINPMSRSFLSTSGANLLSLVNLLNAKKTILNWIVWTLGLNLHMGAPRILFLSWILSISGAKVMLWKSCCFWRDKDVGVHQCTHKDLFSTSTEQTSATMNGSASDFRENMNMTFENPHYWKIEKTWSRTANNNKVSWYHLVKHRANFCGFQFECAFNSIVLRRSLNHCHLFRSILLHLLVGKKDVWLDNWEQLPINTTQLHSFCGIPCLLFLAGFCTRIDSKKICKCVLLCESW